jgi:hypothetical protein
VCPTLLLTHDFPSSPARIELSPQLCLVLPHIESDGSLCHGVLSDPVDHEDPVDAVRRVLSRLDRFLTDARDPSWIEAEFHRERQDYWDRYVAAAQPPKDYDTQELYLDVDIQSPGVQIARAVPLADTARALATTGKTSPGDVARARGWRIGTIINGSAFVSQLPPGERWTPRTWPRSFKALSSLVGQISGKQAILPSWYFSTKWAHKAPVFVVLLQETSAFGWSIVPVQTDRRQGEPRLIPIAVTRIDRAWCLARDHQLHYLSRLTEKHVVVFGCGSLGAPVVELLARAGVGRIDIVDPDVMKAENISRHTLGASDLGHKKVVALAARMARGVPGITVNAFAKRAEEWFAGDASGAPPDLVVDCTGERSVRVTTSHLRPDILKSAPVMMAWMEPHCAAAHIVTIAGPDIWPQSDPAETAINIAQWPDNIAVELPGCGQGFHPYGMADVWQVAGWIAENAVSMLKGQGARSEVISMVRARKYFEAVAPGVTFNREPQLSGDTQLVIERRPLCEALNGS